MMCLSILLDISIPADLLDNEASPDQSKLGLPGLDFILHSKFPCLLYFPYLVHHPSFQFKFFFSLHHSYQADREKEFKETGWQESQ